MIVRISMGWLPALLAANAAWSQHQVSLPADLAEPGTQVVDVYVGISYSEGPAVDPEGNLYFSEDPDVNTGRIWKITPDGIRSVYKEPSRGANGLEFDNEGRLHITMLDSVLRVEKDGADGSGHPTVTVLAAKGAQNLGRVNDLSISSMGSLFFTNLNGNTLFFRGTDGQIKTRNCKSCNGVEWIEEKGIVYFSSGGLQKCKVNNATGEIGTCSSFAGSTDGLTTDVNGNVWRADWTQGKIFADDSTGKQLGFIAIDAKDVPGKRFTSGAVGNVSNCHFGGPDNKTLFITGDGGLYKVQLKVAGRNRPQWPTGVDSRLARPTSRETGARLLGASGVFFLDRESRPVALDGKRLKMSHVQ